MNSQHFGGRQRRTQDSGNDIDSQRDPEGGVDYKVKGLVRFRLGHMEHRDHDEKIWKPAVYHEELRDALIAEASLRGSYG